MLAHAPQPSNSISRSDLSRHQPRSKEQACLSKLAPRFSDLIHISLRDHRAGAISNLCNTHRITYFPKFERPIKIPWKTKDDASGKMLIWTAVRSKGASVSPHFLNFCG